MPHLKLLDKGAKKSHRVDATEAVVGRDPAAAIFVEGDAAKTVSGRHARFFLDDGKWYVEDTGSRNGTFIGTRKLEPGARHALSVGEVVGLGLTGTQLLVEEVVGRAFAATMLEAPPVAPLPSGTMPMRRSEAIRAGIHDLNDPQSTDEVRVTLRSVQSGGRMVGQADRVTIGRALECLIRVEGEAATSVSRVHAEVVAINGAATIRDAGSRHGTYVNGKKLAGPHALRHGDLIMLGPGGPTFTVDEAIVVPPGTKPPAGAAVATSDQTNPTGSIPNRKEASAITPIKQKSLRGREEAFVSESPTPAVARAAIKTRPKGEPGPVTRLARASGVGRTALLRNVLEEVSVQSAKRIRVFIWATVGVFAVITSAIVLYAKRHMDRTDAQLEVASVGFKQQAAALDSLRAAATSDAAIAKASLDSAMSAAAPKAVLDSLRGALADADRRSVGLEIGRAHV